MKSDLYISIVTPSPFISKRNIRNYLGGVPHSLLSLVTTSLFIGDLDIYN